MSTTTTDLDQLIASAMKKIDGKKENAICRFLPGATGGYMHHFTLRKMKNEGKTALAEMIRKYIIDAEKPANVKPKQRAARGSRKKKGQVILSDADVEYLLPLVRASGNKDMIRKLLPRKDLKAIKRELIASIRNGKVNNNLWNAFIECVHSGS
jgi:hypothetical protein